MSGMARKDTFQKVYESAAARLGAVVISLALLWVGVQNLQDNQDQLKRRQNKLGGHVRTLSKDIIRLERVQQDIKDTIRAVLQPPRNCTNKQR